MTNWWIPILITAGAVTAILALLSYALFRTACLPRRDLTDESFFRSLEKKAEASQMALIRECHAAYLTAPGEEVFIRSDDGLQLRGHYLPAENADGRVLLMCHGWNSTPARDFAMALPYFHSLGWDILLIDQRAQNGSEGRYMTFGARERRDVCGWVRWLCERGASRIVLDGISMGATTALLALGEPLPPEVKGAIADCGFDSAVRELRYLGKQRHLPVRPLLPFLDLWARALAGFSFYDTDTTTVLAKTSLPILLLHGTGDTFVPCECTTRNAAACRSEHTVILAEGAPHGFSYVQETARCQQAIAAFLAPFAAPVPDSAIPYPSDKE